MINVRQRLKDYGIISPYSYYTTKDLQELKQLIQTEQDWDLYYRTWQQNRHKYNLAYIKHVFKKKKLINR